MENNYDPYKMTAPEPQLASNAFQASPESVVPTAVPSQVPIEPPAVEALPPSPESLVSQPVVKVLSPRGIEYAFLTIALFTAAAALGSVLISLLNGQTGFNVLAFPVAALVVALPVFAGLFLRLKKTELLYPSLRYEASKRRSTQFTQIVSFVISFFTLIGFISLAIAKMAGEYHGSLVKVFLDVLVVLVITFGLLAYYWHDEHRLGQ